MQAAVARGALPPFSLWCPRRQTASGIAIKAGRFHAVSDNFPILKRIKAVSIDFKNKNKSLHTLQFLMEGIGKDLRRVTSRNLMSP